MAARDDKKLLIEARARFKKCLEHDEENRKNYRENMKFAFVPGEQWEETVKAARGIERPCREFNETRVKIKSVINHMRANRPMAKFVATEEGDVETAEVYEAIWLNTWNNSKADNISDQAAEHQVAGGMGAWRVTTEYCQGSIDQQDIRIRVISNPLCLHADYACKEQDKSDARFWFYATKLSEEDFDSRYPDAKRIEFEPDELGEDDIDDDNSVWLAEYWRKEPYQQKLALLTDGRTVDLEAEAKKGTQIPREMIVKERTVASHKIVQYVLSGDAVLEGPIEFASRHFPFVMVYGEYVVIDGKTYWYGLTHHMKDAQRAKNETQTAVYEAVNRAPLEADWATPDQAKGLMGQWKDSIVKNTGVKLFNHDPKEPGPPKRTGGIAIPAALIQASAMSTDLMKTVSGIFDASLGQESNETSGRAIRARQDQGLIATYNFSDNMAKAKERTAVIVMDLIPKIIDTPRAIRVLGKDGAEKWVRVNQPGPNGEVINDLSRGKYDLTIVQGPNLATQRQESAEFYQGLMQALPAQAPLFADVAVKNMDIPGADQVAERLKATLPPQIQQMLSTGKPLPPEVQAAMQQADMAMQQVQRQGQLVQQAAEEAQTEKAAAEKAKSDAQIAQANIKVAEANLAKAEAEFKLLVAEAKQQVAEQQSQGEQSNAMERNDLVQQVSEALQAIQEQSQALAQMYADQLALLQHQTAQTLQISAEQAQKAAQPKRKAIRIVRQNGQMVGELTDLDTNQTTQVSVSRQPGGGYAGEVH